MNFKELWDEQKDFTRTTIHWMDALYKTVDSKEKRSDLLSQKKILEMMLKRMEDNEAEIK